MTVTIPISSLFYIVMLIVSELIFVYRLPRRKYFWARLPLYLIAYPAAVYGLGYLAVLFDAHVERSLANYFFQIGYFAVIFFMSIPAVMFCWQVSLRDAVYFCIAGYSVEHIGQVFTNILLFVFSATGVILSAEVRMFVINFAFKTVVIFALYLLFLRPMLTRKTMTASDKRIIAVSAINLTICMVLNIMKGYGMGNPVNGFTNSVICGLYALFGCFLCLALQIGYFKENSLKEDNFALEQLLRQEAKKQKLSKDTVDLINIKCHDLKYRLGKLESGGVADNKGVFREIYDSFSIYDSLVKTGNEVFDTLIMNVYPVCVKNSIRFTYIVDGQALDCLSLPDISSLFGNLLDNAMESVIKEDEEKRIISLNVRKERRMLVIHIHNQCSVAPDFEDGLPMTTKEDARYHGFGVRSIKYLVGKYDGDVRMYWEDGVFSVDIVIPA